MTSCPVGEFLQELPDNEHREDLEGVLANHVSSVIISQWMKARGGERCSTAAINKHRGQECACYG